MCYTCHVAAKVQSVGVLLVETLKKKLPKKLWT